MQVSPCRPVWGVDLDYGHDRSCWQIPTIGAWSALTS
jgi:hypothetical protein